MQELTAFVAAACCAWSIASPIVIAYERHEGYWRGKLAAVSELEREGWKSPSQIRAEEIQRRWQD